MKPLVLVLLSTLGCQKANIQLRAPGAMTTPSSQYNDSMHLDVVGFVEATEPVDLARACGAATADSIHEEVGIVGGVVDVLESWIPFVKIYNTRVSCQQSPALALPPGLFGGR